MNSELIYKSKPIFGLDIGHGSIKAVQIKKDKKGNPLVVGYGYTGFDKSAIDENGVIVDPVTIAKATKNLLLELKIGTIDAASVSVALPAAKTYARVIELPKMSDEDLHQAVNLEADQYIPTNINELYLDYEVRPAPNSNQGDTEIQVMMVGAPHRLSDSYLHLLRGLGLEVHNIETNVNAITRAVMHTYNTNGASIIIDFGAESSDLALFNDSVVMLTNTINVGGDSLTWAITDQLHVSNHQAYQLKTRVGLSESKWQKKIKAAIDPVLDEVVSEIGRMIRYYSDRNEDSITQLLILGGGANLPGLEEYLSEKTGLGVEICDVWNNLGIANIQQPHELETTLYTTAIGLALQELER